MKRPTTTAALALAIALALTAAAAATEFWDMYAQKLAYNHSIKSGAVPALGMNQRLSSDEVLGVATKSFSQTFGARLALPAARPSCRRMSARREARSTGH